MTLTLPRMSFFTLIKIFLPVQSFDRLFCLSKLKGQFPCFLASTVVMKLSPSIPLKAICPFVSSGIYDELVFVFL